jgi:uncharacterized DUF497 family protein
VRIRFDAKKNVLVRQKHGISLERAQEIFAQAYIVDRRRGDPEQFRAIGWCGSRLCSVIYEVREDAEGEYFHLVTAWHSTREEEQAYGENV